jgi:hypothetical protein
MKVECKATLNKVILEPGDFIWGKLLISHDVRTNYVIRPIGKIAGIRSINFLDLDASRAKPSIWHQAFSGRPLAVLLRTAGYGFVIITSMLLGVRWANYRIRQDKIQARRNQIANFKGLSEDGPLASYRWVIDAFLAHGEIVMFTIGNVLLEPTAFATLRLDNTTVSNLIATKLEESKAVKFFDNKPVFDSKFKEFILMFWPAVFGKPFNAVP